MLIIKICKHPESLYDTPHISSCYALIFFLDNFNYSKNKEELLEDELQEIQ